MTLYDALKASKGLPVSDSYAALWGKSAAESGIKTLTGRMPLFFKTSELKLRDWVIYGNDEPGERNTPQVYTEWEQGTRVPTAQGGETYNKIKANASNRVRNVNLIPVVTPFYYEINPGYQIGATFFDENGLSLGSGSNIAFRSAPYIYTGVGKYVSFVIKNNVSTAITPSDDFEVKVASPYYQLGVGKKTENGYVLNIIVGLAPIPEQPVTHIYSSKTINIGDSPLTEGQTLSMSEFGDINIVPDSDVFIAAVEALDLEAPLSYNQPEMKIKYKE